MESIYDDVVAAICILAALGLVAMLLITMRPRRVQPRRPWVDQG